MSFLRLYNCMIARIFSNTAEGSTEPVVWLMRDDVFTMIERFTYTFTINKRNEYNSNFKFHQKSSKNMKKVLKYKSFRLNNNCGTNLVGLITNICVVNGLTCCNIRTNSKSSVLKRTQIKKNILK